MTLTLRKIIVIGLIGAIFLSGNVLLVANWLAEKGVTMMTKVKYEEITDKGLIITTNDGKRQTIEADSIVPALPLTPDTELLKSLEGKVPEVYPIGDCKEPALIPDAVAAGWEIANKI